MTQATYWFVNKPSEVGEEALAAYLASGVWQAPNPAKVRDELTVMNVGDPIALKIVQNRTTGLPFFNADRPASVMTILATGSIESVDPVAGSVGVRWDGVSEPREWYFWTRFWPVWRVEPDTQPRGRQLVDFAFHGKPQDLDFFLDEEFWSARYLPWPKFTWIPFYEEFASRLLEHRHDRTGLIELLLELVDVEPKLGYLDANSFLEGGPSGRPDIDPFTVMGAFNRGVTKEARQRVAGLLGGRLGVQSPVPSDFEGVPILNNMKSWFVGYAADQDESDIDDLWQVFESAVGLADGGPTGEKVAFAESFDKAKAVRGVNWNLTVGLYWARPNRFPTLDARSRPYIKNRYELAMPVTGAEYLALGKQLRERFETQKTTITSFPLLSLAAWMGDDDEVADHSLEGFARWAARIGESLDLEQQEHRDKRRAAALAGEAREQARRGDDSWPETFKRALNATNTVDFRFKDTLNRAITEDPVAGLAVLDSVWRKPELSSLDALQTELRSLLGRVAPGAATDLGALLLMSVEPEENAPYSPTRTERWYHLTDFDGPQDNGSAASRYATMIDFLVALRDEIHSVSSLGELSLLETQGLAWATTEYPPPEAWDELERRALMEWRGQKLDDPRAWLVRGKAVVANWIDEGFVSLPASYLGSLRPGSSLAEVKEAVEAGYMHQDYGQRKALTSEYYSFLSVMKPGDLVATLDAGQLHVGVIDGGAEYVDGVDGDRLRRQTHWQAEIPSSETSSSLSSLLDRQGSLVDITEGLSDLRSIAEEGSPARESDAVIRLPSADSSLAETLFMSQGELQEMIDLLEARKQIVFYGPPGTGKTFVAKALARHIVGPDDSSHMQLVQFHPSYSYEDFFEGYRPIETSIGQASFALQPGPLARIAAAAREDKDHPYVLVIDEMNRANLAKVFGELYFLLEYRKESMQLQYRPDEAFRLPENLYIIGTMNTADRSIALLDAAMRRRFSFLELHPDEEPVRGVLDQWLEKGNHSRERSLLLGALNAAIEDQDRDLRIGPSYLMRDEAAAEAGLERVWKYDIMPLLEEHYYGRLTRDQIHDRFGLAAIRASLTTENSAVDHDGPFDAGASV